MCCSYSWRKYLQRRQHRVRRGLAEAAEAGVAHDVAQRSSSLSRSSSSPSPRQIFSSRLSICLRADAAGRAFAAGFVAAEFEEEPRDVHHAGIFVHDDQTAGTHDGAELLERFVFDRRVEMLRGDDAAGRAAGLDGLELLAVGNAAADFVR